MIMTAAALTSEQKADLATALKGNICRCTGYRAIADAVAGHAHVAQDGSGRACGFSLPTGRAGRGDGRGALYHGRRS